LRKLTPEKLPLAHTYQPSRRLDRASHQSEIRAVGPPTRAPSFSMRSQYAAWEQTTLLMLKYTLVRLSGNASPIPTREAV
jgi:hypothetical protein